MITRPDVQRAVVDLARRLRAISSEELRSRTAAGALQALSPSEAAATVGVLLRHARDDRASADAVAAIGRALSRGLVDADFLADCLGAAHSLGDRLAEAVFAAGPAHREYDHLDEPFVDKGMRRLTLGERRALSKTHDRDLLMRLAHDQDPRVVTQLLQNPRATEREALVVASRRPTRPLLLEKVLQSRFGSSRRVRRAVAHNPYASVALAARAITGLPAVELRQLLEDPSLSPAVREVVRSQLVGRGVRPAERDRNPVLLPDPKVDSQVESLIRTLEAEHPDEEIELARDDQ